MSDDNFWESEESASEQELDETAYASSEEEYSEEAIEPSEEDELQADLEVLQNAGLRLEQGNLYKMLLKHDLFEGIEADERAIKNVQKELRIFIRGRLEVLVGLKEDPRLVRQPRAVLPFSDLEIQLLKQFLAKVTPQAQTLSSPVEQQKKPAVIKPATQPQQGFKPIQKQSTAVLQKKKPLPRPENPQPEERKPLTKAPSQMTVQELMEHNRASSAKKRAAGTSKKIPMPDAQQVETLYATRFNTDPGAGLIGAIMKTMNKPVGAIETVSNENGDSSSNDDRL